MSEPVTMTGREWVLNGDRLVSDRGVPFCVTLTQPVQDDAFLDWFGLCGCDSELTGLVYQGELTDWTVADRINVELATRTDHEGKPIVVTDEAFAGAVGAVRWPGVEFTFQKQTF